MSAEHHKEPSKGTGPARATPAPGEALSLSFMDSLESLARRDVFPIRTALNSPEVEHAFGRLEDKTHVCCVDLELTCWAHDDPDAKAEEEMEIIEIGVTILSKEDDYKEQDRISITVKPTIHTQLSTFCTELTGISQEEVDLAETLPNTLEALRQRLPGPKAAIWAAWGPDTDLIQSEMAKKEIQPEDFPLDPRYVNVSAFFRAEHGDKKKGLKKALETLGIKQESPAHRALPDAISLARVFKAMELTPLDAFVSNSRTYKDRLLQAQTERAQEFAKRFGIKEDFANRLLTLTHWDFQRAKTVLSLFNEGQS